MLKILGMTLLVVGTAATAMAAGPAAVPEVDASGAAAALSLVAGAMLVIRGRRKK